MREKKGPTWSHFRQDHCTRKRERQGGWDLGWREIELEEPDNLRICKWEENSKKSIRKFIVRV